MNDTADLNDTVKETVRRHWDQRAATFDDLPHHGLHTDDQRRAWLARAAAWAGAEPVDVLDIGCGTGFFSLQFAELGHRATGLDIAESMLDLARAKAGQAGVDIRFDLGDAERSAYPAASFDLLVERHVIWTLPNPAVALTQWARILRPGGLLVLVEGDWNRTEIHPDYVGIHDQLPLYGGRAAATLAALAEEAGYHVDSVEPLDDPVLWGEPVERDRYALHVVTSPGR